MLVRNWSAILHHSTDGWIVCKIPRSVCCALTLWMLEGWSIEASKEITVTAGKLGGDAWKNMLRERKADHTDTGGRRTHSTAPSQVTMTCGGDKKTPCFTSFSHYAPMMWRSDFSNDSLLYACNYALILIVFFVVVLFALASCNNTWLVWLASLSQGRRHVIKLGVYW